MQKNILIIKPYGSDNNSFLQYIENDTNFRLFWGDKLEEDFKGVMIFCTSKHDLKKFTKNNNQYVINFQLEDESHYNQVTIGIRNFISREKNILSLKVLYNENILTL